MRQIAFVFLFFSYMFFANGQSIQRVDVTGVVYALNNDVENVTVYNVSSNKGVITNTYGEFILDVALNDRVEISAVQFQTVSVTVDETVIKNKQFNIQLIEQVNKLDAVVLSQGLSGNLLEDINNVKTIVPIALNMGDLNISFEYNDDKAFDNKVIESHLKSLTNKGEFYNGVNFVEIFRLLKGNKKKSKKVNVKTDTFDDDEELSPNERRLFEADNGGFFLLGESGVGLNSDKIINRITGRTKILKERVLIEENEELLSRIQIKFSDIFFNEFTLNEDLREDFFYFCQQGLQFRTQCQDLENIKVMEFLKEKLISYKSNLESIKD